MFRAGVWLSGFVLVLGLTYGIILLYIISYTILFSSVPIFSFPIYLPLLSFPSSSSSPNHSIRVGTYIYLFMSFFRSILLFFCSLPILSSQSFSSFPSTFLILQINSPHFILYVSVLGYTYLYYPDSKLTPHVLSEWMVEVCAGDKYRFWFMF